METAASLQQPTGELLALYAGSKDARLRDRIIERHDKLVHVVARRFARPGIPVEDLAQCAWIALIGAVDRFTPSRGASFSTYAFHCMVGEVKRYFRDRTWFIKSPRRLQEIFAKLNLTRERLERQLGREPALGEMAAALEVSEEELLEATEVQHGYSPLGLTDHCSGSKGNAALPIEDSLGSLDETLEQMVEYAPLQAAIGGLDERRQAVVRMRFTDGFTQQEVASRLGISQMHVCRLERTAIRKMRVALGVA